MGAEVFMELLRPLEKWRMGYPGSKAVRGMPFIPNKNSADPRMPIAKYNCIIGSRGRPPPSPACQVLNSSVCRIHYPAFST